jgi:hypothetical protein
VEMTDWSYRDRRAHKSSTHSGYIDDNYKMPKNK